MRDCVRAVENSGARYATARRHVFTRNMHGGKLQKTKPKTKKTAFYPVCSAVGYAHSSVRRKDCLISLDLGNVGPQMQIWRRRRRLRDDNDRLFRVGEALRGK